ncbi:beta-ketoacyl synthase chain length factor [Kingella kingae]|nr:beta-ketoacyl synthase chain length factor [Kingella kingae]MDK4623753.1 beta-ketoacyl synthase chain length factor [Kingella kingae]MDK4667287.1 beta-ketoacyl synthase chain length factor [Kingella kingae]
MARLGRLREQFATSTRHVFIGIIRIFFIGRLFIMQFNIRTWHAVSTRLTTPEHWLDWAHGTLSPHDLPEQKPDVAFLPALQRRRLSLSARLMFQAAHQAVGEQHCPTVFVSHDGEVNRNIELFVSLLREQSVSPTSFGLSVHNALVGQWSMLRGDTSENTAIVAQYDGWELACTEAAAMLQDGAKQVLVVAADEPCDLDDKTVLTAPFAYAVAAVLERGSDWTLTRHAATSPTTEPHYWGALDFVCHILLQKNAFRHFYPKSEWQWQHTQ